MKNATNRLKTLPAVWAAFAAAALVGAGGAWADGPVAGVHTWNFPNNANPALPTIPAANLRAIIAPGEFADGWFGQNSVFGNASGVWDLGRHGTITLMDTADITGGSTQGRTFKVRVTQYYDGGIYSESASVAVPGASLIGTTSQLIVPDPLSAPPLGGSWSVEETTWRAGAGVPVTSAMVTSAYNGSLIDQLLLETGSGPALPELKIRTLAANGQIEISWPALFQGMVLQSNDDLGNAQGWANSATPVQVTGDRCSITIDAAGASRFFRLKQP